jgi:hypothetical protein
LSGNREIAGGGIWGCAEEEIVKTINIARGLVKAAGKAIAVEVFKNKANGAD